MTDFRALCFDLADRLEIAITSRRADANYHEDRKAIDCTRRAIAQSEPVGPTLDPTPNDLSYMDDEEFDSLCPQGYHATGNFEAQGQTDLRDETLLVEADACFLYGEGKYTASPEEVVAFARRVILAGQRYAHPTPQPIPVSERLPGPEDCDAEGRCWVHQPCAASPEAPDWMLLRSKYASASYGATCWLPATALPLPQQSAPNP